MTLQGGQTAIQVYLDSIRKITVSFQQSLGNTSGDTADLKKLPGFANEIRRIRSQLSEEHDSNAGRSRIIERFFEQWNSMVFGVLYVEEIYLRNGLVTESQYAILLAAIDEIISYTKRFI